MEEFRQNLEDAGYVAVVFEQNRGEGSGGVEKGVKLEVASGLDSNDDIRSVLDIADEHEFEASFNYDHQGNPQLAFYEKDSRAVPEAAFTPVEQSDTSGTDQQNADEPPTGDVTAAKFAQSDADPQDEEEDAPSDAEAPVG